MGGGEVATVLECRGVQARHGRIRVVHGVDLAVRQGEVVVVLGPNGAGKSSLLGAIAGTVQGGGDIWLGGQALQSLGPHRRAASGLSLVPEARRNIFPTMSVAENLDIGLRLSRPEARGKIRDSLLELWPILRERARTAAGLLSGGEQQMLAIAVALGRAPDLLMLDEPSQGLAPAVFDALEHALDVLRGRGLAVLLAEQNLAFAARVADRFVVLSQGRIVGSGDREALQRHDAMAALYFGVAEAAD